MDLLLPPSYFPAISYFSLLVKHKRVVFDWHSYFEKQTLRSRCEILGANGKIKLIVPLHKWRNKTLITDVKIDNTERWQDIHYRSLTSAYRNSPFFEYYQHQFKQFYKEEFETLIALDFASVDLIMNLLKLNIEIGKTSQYVATATSEYLDFRQCFSKKNKQNRPDIASYIQVFSDRFAFTNDLSILDLLFNLGPSSVPYLQKLVFDISDDAQQ